MTQAAALLPPVPAPPHDPYSIVLDWRAGWRASSAVSNVEVSPLDNTWVLKPAPGGTTPLANASGTFGGLVLPDNVVFGPDRIVLLLDRDVPCLLRFDPCTCEFVPLQCIAGEGSKPRELHEPGAMVATCGNLYICDAGNKRVQVFGLRGLPLRAIWQQPITLPQPWLPVAAAADQRARVFIGDRNNGMVHVFTAAGRYVCSLDGLGAIEHLTVDCDGRLYVQVNGSATVSVIDPDAWLDTHLPLETHDRADEVASRFPTLPFVVLPDGHLRLCDGEFDEHGNSVEPELVMGPVYQTGGSLITVALDSAIYKCVWDRLEIDGDFPEGTGVVASVYTSETPIPDAIIQTLTDDWVTCPPCDSVSKPWDCMLQAPPGRYLWLRLSFTGHGDATARIRKVRVVFPRVSLRRYLPGAYGSDVQAAEFTDRFLAIFDRTFRGIESTLDWQAHFFDPLSAPADDRDASRDFLSWLGTWLGVVLDKSWPLARRRRYLKEVGRLFACRGTLAGLRQNLQLFLGMPLEDDCPDTSCGPCTTTKPPAWKPPELVLEHYRLRRWMFLGAGRLGDEAKLWGDDIVNRSRLDGVNCRGNARLGVTTLNTTQDPVRDPFWVYAHKVTVFVPASCARTPVAQRGLDRLIKAERPAHVAYSIRYVEPKFRIGVQSMIGFDSAIGRYPDANIRLGEAQPGQGHRARRPRPRRLDDRREQRTDRHHDPAEMRTDMHNAATCPTCQATALTRNHYFTGKLMVERDFTDEQRYFRERLRLHNQRLHGSGVVCGLGVKQHPNPACQDRFVLLEPGSAIDCCGDDILVTAEDTVDLQSFPAVQALFDNPDGKDHVLQLAICYRECPTEEIPVLYDDCACDDSQCAPNRILESYSLDVIVDPVIPAPTIGIPELVREPNIGVAAPRAVALDEAGGRVYVLSKDTVYAIDSTSHSVLASSSLGREGVAMTISHDAKRLYVFVIPTTLGNDGEVWFFDTANLAAGATEKKDVLGSKSQVPWLTRSSKPAVLAAYGNGTVVGWKPADTAGAPSIKLAAPLATGVSSIAASSNGKTAWIARGTETLDVLDLTASSPITPTQYKIAGAKMHVLSVLASTTADKIAGAYASSTTPQIHVFDPAATSGSVPLASASLAKPVRAMVAAPGGNWVYVDENDDMIEVIDIGRMLQHLPVTPSARVSVGPKTESVIITASGQKLYVPYAGNAADGSDGGVAVFDILDADCAAPFHQVRACPDCGAADCIVVATIKGYQPGYKFLDKVDPAPADDAVKHIARIDELADRKILASTETIQEVVECLLAHPSGGGIAGPQGPVGPPGGQGPQGDPGDTGPAGPGLSEGVTRISLLSWRHGSVNPIFMLDLDDTGKKQWPALVIGFSNPVHLVGGSATPTPQQWRNMRNIFQVEALHADAEKDPDYYSCTCRLTSKVVPVRIIKKTGHLIQQAVVTTTFPADGIAFLLPPRLLATRNLELWVRLLGELVLDDQKNAVAADFVGGVLDSGDIRMRPIIPAAPKIAIPGGVFESWLTLETANAPTFDGALHSVNLNNPG